VKTGSQISPIGGGKNKGTENFLPNFVFSNISPGQDVYIYNK
jgi:hypothetical protein